MSRCVACDAVLRSSEMYTREVQIDEDTIIEVEEDMCSKCRKILVDSVDEEDSDLIENLALDILSWEDSDYD